MLQFRYVLTVVAPSSKHSCKETTDEDDYLGVESDRSFDTKRPKVISLKVRGHGGKEAHKPFEIRPSQFVSSAFLGMKFKFVLVLTTFLIFLVYFLTLIPFSSC